MPIYEYQCAKCGHEFEREQRITEKPIQRCPSCRSLRAKRLISNTSFVLKGGGWYSDLYSRKPGKEAGASGRDGDSKDSKGDSKDSKGDSKDSKGDSKPAARSDSGSKGDSKSKGTKASGTRAA